MLKKAGEIECTEISPFRLKKRLLSLRYSTQEKQPLVMS